MTRQQFADYLSDNILIADGATGTMLALRGATLPYDAACLTAPETVATVHKEYYDAGARLIETNTFGANRLKLALSLGFQGDPLASEDLRNQAREINLAAVKIARQATGADALIFGAVGPVGKPLEPLGVTRLEEARLALGEQIEWLVEAGVDGLMLESFTDQTELKIAFDEARRIAPDLPIIASKAFIEDGESLMEGLPERFAALAASWGADAVSANCIVGPQRMLEIVRSMALGTDLPIAALPTPGLPQLVRGEVIYDIHPDYFAKGAARLVDAGARIVGGCCGTTPDHVRAIAETLKGAKPKPTAGEKIRQARAGRQETEIPEAEPSKVSKMLGNQRVITVELDLPRGLNVTKVMDGARLLKEKGVHMIDISDGARARLRMNPISISHLIQRDAGIEVMMHFACRDRNLLAIQADLLGAHSLGLRNILAITGDPAQIGDYPSATSVFDVDAVGLTRILNRFNEGYDLAGNSIGMKTNFTIAVAYNPLANDLKAETDRLKRKADEGAHLIYTQPIFEKAYAEIAAGAAQELELPWLIGVLPLRNRRHAEFMHNEVPGIVIPDAIRRRMDEAPEEDALKTGIEIAQNFLTEAGDLAQGIYLMPPAGSAKIAAEVLEPFL
ncbi:MAG: bifunctional homocysteine S-methyltransferase/methylenetetrahydrofolate reductase [Armatimonadetes bacterium]|nr:bifunctional homocysteine S-methyltransferase/methylenetetrahydrofolate reductase [Armatimonadota bacterium]